MTDDTPLTQHDLVALQRQIAWLRAGLIIAVLLLAALAATTLRRHTDTNSKVIRTQGVVIVDAQGHDRILIGAPTPTSANRTRKDDASDGIIFLGTTGADRLAIGQMPAPHIGGKTYPRLGNGDNYGMTLYDTTGNERGGMGFMGMGRAVIGLDRATPPYDAIGMMVDDKEDFAGLMINYGDPKAQDAAIELGNDPNHTYIKINSKDGQPRALLNFDGKNQPAWQFNDAEPETPAKP